MKRGILTVATGPRRYRSMASALLESIRLNSPGFRLAVATDSAGACDDRLRGLADELVVVEERMEPGTIQKLHLDRWSPFDETLFIDSDCLVFRPLDRAWDYYRGSGGFGVIAYGELTAEDSHPSIQDLGAFLSALGLRSIPAFNGGIYYFDRSEKAAAVFRQAREIVDRKDALGLLPFKNSGVADEPVIAAAMGLADAKPLPWDECLTMATGLDSLASLRGIDVLRGMSRFQKQSWSVAPDVIHFNMNAQHCYPYLRECLRLRLRPASGFARMAVPPAAFMDCAARRLRRKWMEARG